MTRADFAQTQGIIQRQRMRNSGLIEFGRHHPDIVGQRPRNLLEDFEPGGVDAVVIGAENSHPLRCLSIEPSSLDVPVFIPPTRQRQTGPDSTKIADASNPAQASMSGK